MASKQAREARGRSGSCRVRQCGSKQQTSMAKGLVLLGCLFVVFLSAAAAAALPRDMAPAAHQGNQNWTAGHPLQKPAVYILPAPGTSNAQAEGSKQLQGHNPRLPTGRTPPSAAAVAAVATAAAATAASGSNAAAKHRAALRRGRAMYRLTAWLDNLLPGAAQGQPLGPGAAHAQPEAGTQADRQAPPIDDGTQSLRDSADGESPAAAADGWLEGSAPHRHMLGDNTPFPPSHSHPASNDAHLSPALQAVGNPASGPAPPVLSSFQTSVGNDDPAAAATAANAASNLGAAPGMRVVLLPDGTPYPFNGTALTVNVTALAAAVATNLLGPPGLPAVQAEAVEVRGMADRAVVLTFTAKMPQAGAAAVAAAAAGLEGVKVSSRASAGPLVMTVVVPAGVVDGSNEVQGGASAAAAAAFAAAALPHPAGAVNATPAGAEGGTEAAAASTASTEVEVELQKVRRIRNPGGGRGGGRAVLQHLVDTLRTLQQRITRASRAAARQGRRHGSDSTTAAAGESTAVADGNSTAVVGDNSPGVPGNSPGGPDNSTAAAAGNSTDAGRRPGGNSTAVSGNSTVGLPVHRPPRGVKPRADVLPLLPPTLPGTVVATDAPVPAAPAAVTGVVVPEPSLEVAPALNSLDSEPAQPQAQAETETEAETEAESELEVEPEPEAEAPHMSQSLVAAMAAAGNIQQKARLPPAHRSPAGASAKLARVRVSWQKRANGSINGAVASG